MYPCIYKAKIWDSVHQREEKIKGITFANTFAEAMEKIESYYGEDLNSIELELQEEQTIWELETYKIDS